MSRRLLPTFKRRKRRAGRPRLPGFLVDVRRFALGVGTVLVLSILMSVHFLPDKVALRVGDRSPTEIRATRSVTYADTDATSRLRESAANSVSNVYDRDRTAPAQAARAVAEIFEKIGRVREDSGLPSIARKTERLAEEMRAPFSPDQIRSLLLWSPATLDRLQQTARRLVEDEMEKEIRSDTDDLAHARESYADNVRRAVSLKADRALLLAMGDQALRPNSLFNRRKTERQRETARGAVLPVTGEIRPGDIVVHEGELFSQIHLDKCEALGLVNPRIDLVTGFAIGALAAAMVFLVGLYIRRAYSAIYASPKHLFLLAALVTLGVFGLKIFGNMLGLSLSIAQFGYLGVMMVVAAGMLVTVLLNAPLAILVTALLAVQSGLIMNHEIRFAVMALISGLVGIYSVSNIRDRMHLLRASIAVAATNLALVWVLGGLLGDTLREVVTGSAWAVLAAALAIPIFWFGVTALEKPFGILTHVWLLELSASERPLLRQLCVTAPGTYAHSIMVGNLAEAGAEAIGADTLFCRVASYYHDIGKMRRPHCFVENQRAENIHDRLNPSLSALIIASHVRDGLELADQYRLPQQIKDIIAEHHGTSLIRYFYHQARALTGNTGPVDPVLEQHFRYDGPRPQTRESGIIMLADTVEAAARCLEKPSPARLQSLVESLIHDKLVDGQLDECDLTFKDIQKIQAAFVRILSAMLHGRIDYPELRKMGASPIAAQEAKRTTADAGLYSELPDAPREDEAVIGSRPESPRR